MLMILDPPPASSSSEMFDFDPHHEEEQTVQAAVPGYIQCSSQQCYFSQQSAVLQ